MVIFSKIITIWKKNEQEIICFTRNFTRKNKRKDTLGLLPVVRDLRNGAGGSSEDDHEYNKTRKDDSLCDILSSKPIRAVVDFTEIMWFFSPIPLVFFFFFYLDETGPSSRFVICLIIVMVVLLYKSVYVDYFHGKNGKSSASITKTSWNSTKTLHGSLIRILHAIKCFINNTEYAFCSLARSYKHFTKF